MSRRSKKVPKSHPVLPWMASFTFHLALGLVAAFVIYLLSQHVDDERRHIVVVPNAFDDPAYAEHQGLGTGSGEVVHQSLGSLDGAGPKSGSQAASLLGSGPLGNSFGAGGPVSPGMPTNSASVGGTPGGNGMAVSSLFGSHGDGKNIVYILDHSGSMVDNFGFLRDEAINSVNKLSPLQHFAVILVSDKVKMVGPERMQRADMESKADFARLIKLEYAEGQNDDLLEPFEQAFSKAFAMNPDLIFFLTDGKFGKGLIGKVAEMNKGKHVTINTLAFVTEEPEYKGALEQLARENNHGTYTFVPQGALGH